MAWHNAGRSRCRPTLRAAAGASRLRPNHPAGADHRPAARRRARSAAVSKLAPARRCGARRRDGPGGGYAPPARPAGRRALANSTYDWREIGEQERGDPCGNRRARRSCSCRRRRWPSRLEGGSPRQARREGRRCVSGRPGRPAHQRAPEELVPRGGGRPRRRPGGAGGGSAGGLGSAGRRCRPTRVGAVVAEKSLGPRKPQACGVSITPRAACSCGTVGIGRHRADAARAGQPNSTRSAAASSAASSPRGNRCP
jgi:hypothetical protein